jgi:hypothetical protein
MQSSMTEKGNNPSENIYKSVPDVVSAPETRDDKTSEQKQLERKVAAKEQIERDLRKPELQNEEKSTKSDFVSDRFRTSKRSINEELASKAKSNEKPSGLKSNPMASIMSAMGLNEKFEIINELFGGDKEKFEQTMQELNMAGSFVEAYNYLNTTFNWDMDNTYVQRILELIRRKLIVKRDEQ